MSVRVVKLNQKTKNFTHYIGREWAGFAHSMFHNPYHVGKDGNRDEVLLKFIEYWYAPEQKDLRATALAVIHPGDVLGCWCKPLQCHGDIIAGYVNWHNWEATCLLAQL